MNPRWYGFAVTCTRPAANCAEHMLLSPIASGWQVELAGTQPHDWNALAPNLLGLADASAKLSTLTQIDKDAGTYRYAAFDDDRLAGALLVAPVPLAIARDWMAVRLGTPLDAAEKFRLLDGRPGGAMSPQGPIVCSCCHVGRDVIADAVAAGCTTVEAIGSATRAGSNCGRCWPELEDLIAGRSAAAG